MTSQVSSSLAEANVERREALDRLLLLIEQQLPGVRASVLVLDDDGVTLRHGGAPNLPAEYSAAIDGLQIGPKAGSCGTAIFRGKAVIVEDIATDPLWENYRDVALPHGLRACWSTPITDDAKKVIGSFAMYYDVPRLPTPPERQLAKTATLLASNIIVRARSHAQLIDRAGMLEQARSQAEEAMTLAKLEAGRMTYNVENVRVGPLIGNARSRIAPLLAEKRITCTCDGCEDELELRCDPEKASQILFNLLAHEAKSASENECITVKTVRQESGAGIRIRCSGTGMSTDEIASVFEPFETAGLALPISRGFARGMGGDLTVQSSPNQGTEFILSLPQPDGRSK